MIFVENYFVSRRQSSSTSKQIKSNLTNNSVKNGIVQYALIRTSTIKIDETHTNTPAFVRVSINVCFKFLTLIYTLSHKKICLSAKSIQAKITWIFYTYINQTIRNIRSRKHKVLSRQISQHA